MIPTKEQIEALAEALPDWLGVKKADRPRLAAAILATLDGWTLVRTADSLDTAWAETEAALPERWTIIELSEYDREEGQLLGWWEASAGIPHANNPALVLREVVTAEGSTPAAALRALAAKLHILAPKADPPA